MLPFTIFLSSLLTLVIARAIPTTPVNSVARAQIVRRQGCNLEPDDPNCELPLWNDNTYNLTFDDLPTTSKALPAAYFSLTFTNFTLAGPNKTLNQYLLPYANSANYIRLRAGYTGLITISSAAASKYPGSLDFFKIESLALGCSLPSTSAFHEQVTSCTIEIVGMCAGPNSTSTQDVEPVKYEMSYVAGENRKGAELQMMSLGTYGERYLCQNFTIRGMPATAEDKMPVVWVDQIQVVEYFESAIF